MLKAHMIIHTEERNHLCNQCGKDFPCKETLIRHMKTHKELNSEENHTCNSCGRIFRDKSNLIHHMRTHTGSKKIFHVMSVEKLSEIRVPSKRTWRCTQEKKSMHVKSLVRHTNGGVVATNMKTHTEK